MTGRFDAQIREISPQPMPPEDPNRAGNSSRTLMTCYDGGAKAFWVERKPEPKLMADGDWLIGYGCATACYATQMAPAARVRLQRDGRIQVEIAGHAKSAPALTPSSHRPRRNGSQCLSNRFRLGDSLPPSVAGGSNSTASTCSAVMMVCDQIRQRLFRAVMPRENLVERPRKPSALAKHRSPSGQGRPTARP